MVVNISRPYKVVITTIVDDYSGFTRLLGAHGLSMYIEVYVDDRVESILFDVGPNETVLSYNVKELNIDIGKVKAIVLSHNHYDHTGGLEYVIKSMVSSKNKPIVIAHPNIFKQSLYIDEESQRLDIGIPYSRQYLEGLGAKMLLIRSPLQISPSTYYLGEIKQYTDIDVEKYKKGFYTILGTGEVVPDKLEDDTGIAVKVEGLGIIVISGCSHSGIANIVYQASKQLNDNVYAVIGGFHMIKYDRKDIEETIRAFKDLGVEEIYVGHCTGFKAEKILSDAYKESFTKLYSGLKMIFQQK